MANKITKWEDVWKLPLKKDEIGRYAWSENGTMALTFGGVNSQDREKIIKAINGEADYKIKNLNKDGCDFFQDDDWLFCVRGWGNLIGTGALNLPKEEAIKIQDGFIEHVFKALAENI